MEDMLNYFIPEDGDSSDHMNVLPLPRVDQLRLQHVKKVRIREYSLNSLLRQMLRIQTDFLLASFKTRASHYLASFISVSRLRSKERMVSIL
jgi:hypothetical protein